MTASSFTLSGWVEEEQSICWFPFRAPHCSQLSGSPVRVKHNQLYHNWPVLLHCHTEARRQNTRQLQMYLQSLHESAVITVSVSSEPDSSGYDPTPKLLFRSVVMTIIWKHVFMLLICITSENSSYKRFAPEHYTSYKLTTIIIFDGVLIIKFKWRTYFCF